MLRVFTSASLQSRLRHIPLGKCANCRETCSSSPLFRVLSSLRSSNGQVRGTNWRRAFYCSESSENDADTVAEAEAKAGEEGAKEADSKAAGAIVPTKPRPEDYLTVSIIFPSHRVLLYVWS
jgi:ATP-dependent Lon protease